VVLLALLKEPERTKAEEPAGVAPASGLGALLRGVFASRMVPVLMFVFIGANFVATVFLAWMPSFLFRKLT
jgi:hypothetical protein